MGLNSLEGTDSLALEIALSRFAEDRLSDKAVLQPQRFFHCRAKILLRLTQASHRCDINAKPIQGQYLPAEFTESNAVLTWAETARPSRHVFRRTRFCQALRRHLFH